MKRRTKGKAFMIGALALMCVIVSACSNKNGSTIASPTPVSSETSATPEVQETATTEPHITLKIFSGDQSNVKNEGIQNNAVANEIKKRFNVSLDIINGDSVKQRTLIAGGDLPDVMIMAGSSSEGALANSMIQGGQVIPLDDLVDKYGPNIKKYNQAAITNMKTTSSNGTGNLYFLPTAQTKAYDGLVTLEGFVNFGMRWDLYKELGSPAMKNEDDFLSVLKQMQDKNPTTKDGKKVYALSAWTDWGTWPYIITYPFAYGYSNGAAQSINQLTGTVEDNYLQKDSIFWKGIKFFNKAYRMGIFDPEGFTMNNAQFVDKINTGQLLASNVTSFWSGGADLLKNTGKPDAEMITVPGPFPVIQGIYPSDNPMGWGLGIAKAITKANKYPERTMQVLDFLSSPEGGRLIYSGIKGIDWDVVDGKPQMIGDAAKPNNGDYLASQGITQYNKLTAFGPTYPGDDGAPLALAQAVNPSTVSAAEKEYAQQNGAELYPGQVYDKLVKEGKFQSPTKYWAAPTLMGTPSDATSQTITKADQYFMANVAKFIMAKDDAAFDAAQAKAMDDFKNMGMDKAYEDLHQLLAKAQETAKQMGFE